MTLTIPTRSSPPGDWWVLEPETGMEVKGVSFQLLVERVGQIMELNGYSRPENLRQYVIDLLCERMPPGYCKQSDEAVPVPQVDLATTRMRKMVGPTFAGQLSIKDVRKGFETFYRWARAGRPLVSLPEANRRGAICAQCIYNKPHRPCPTCSAMYEMVRRLTTRRQTTYYAQLQVCMKCKCCNKTQTQIPMTYLRRQPEHQYPAHCWKRDAILETEPLRPKRTP